MTCQTSQYYTNVLYEIFQYIFTRCQDKLIKHQTKVGDGFAVPTQLNICTNKELKSHSLVLILILNKIADLGTGNPSPTLVIS